MVNLKRKEFYKTEKGLEVKERHKQKAACKRKLLEELSQIKLNKKLNLLEKQFKTAFIFVN